MTKENIPIQIFNWGPCVIKVKIKPEYRKMLLDEAKLNKADFRPRLAGGRLELGSKNWIS